MSEIVLSTSRKKTLATLAACLAFVVTGVFLYFFSDDSSANLAGLLTIALFGFGAIVFLYRLFDRRPRIIITGTGITDFTLKVGEIAWEDIRSAQLKSVHGTKFIVLEVGDSTKYLSRVSGGTRALAKTNRAFGFAELNINLGLIDDPDQVFHMVSERVRESG